MIVDTREEKDLFGPGWNARSRVQEYGGGAAIAYGSVVYFSNFGDLRVYAVDVEKGGEPVSVTPGIQWLSFTRFRLLLTIRGGDRWISRKQKPSIRRLHRLAYSPAPPRRDPRRSHPPVPIASRNLSRPHQHLDEDGDAVDLWRGLLCFA